MIEERHRVGLPDGALALVLHLPGAPSPVPCVVACHGLRASKDSDKYRLLGAEFPAAGLALARFDFRGTGESTGREEETTVGTRVEDARAVLDFLHGHAGLSGRFGLLGSSMGGFVALHVARALGPLPVVTWNAPASLTDLARSRTWEEAGLGAAFLREYASGRYTEAPRGVPCHLVIHAGADEVVSLEHGRSLREAAAEPCDLIVIDGGDHRLTEMTHRKEAVARSLAWFLRYLRDAP